MISNFFHVVVYDPLYNTLIGLYDTVSLQDFGIAIILTTIILKLLLIPLSRKQIESQKGLQEIQPKIKELQKKHKDDKEKQAKEIMALYKKENINPLGGCLPLIIQLVFFIAIYRILIDVSGADFIVDESLLYPFVSNPGAVKTDFLGIVDLTQPNIFLAVITAAAQYWQMKMMMRNRENEAKKETAQNAEKESTKKNADEEKKPEPADFAQMMNTQMLYVFPVLTLFIGVTFGAGLILYWLTSTLFMIAQQWYVMMHKTDIKEG